MENTITKRKARKLLNELFDIMEEIAAIDMNNEIGNGTTHTRKELEFYENFNIKKWMKEKLR